MDAHKMHERVIRFCETYQYIEAIKRIYRKQIEYHKRNVNRRAKIEEVPKHKNPKIRGSKEIETCELEDQIQEQA
jgi:hypothetical protein